MNIKAALRYMQWRLSRTTASYLPRDFYISEEIFSRENEKIFSNLWIFAGLTNELPDHGSWMVKRIGLTEVLIVKDKETYYAHENVCPHRNKQLMIEEYGKGPLVCGYHAWSFRNDGGLRKIPNFETSYLLTVDQLHDACLTSYKITTLGNFLFVNLSENPMPLEKQFSPKIIKSLKLLSLRLHNSYVSMNEERAFNWKLNFENLRDSMHPPVVHAKTLAKNVTFFGVQEKQVPLRKSIKRLSLIDCSYFNKDGEPKKGKKGVIDDQIKPSFGRGYYNWVLFPNFHMASPDGGRTYYIEVHRPASPGRTSIQHYVVSNRPNDPDDFFLEELLQHRLDGTRPVMEEDYAICEQVQKTLPNTKREQNIGAYEHYNANISAAYRNIMRR